MSNVKEIIHDALKIIQEQNVYKLTSLHHDTKIVGGLGFSSLDVAQLIAMLELEFGVDPFSEGVSIMDVSTIGEMQNVYEQSLISA